MPFDSAVAGRTIKDAVGKLGGIKDVPSNLKPDWTNFVLNGTRLQAAVLAVGGPSAKELTDLEAAKKDLDTAQKAYDAIAKKVETGKTVAKAGFKGYGAVMVAFEKSYGTLERQLRQNNDKASKELLNAASACTTAAKKAVMGIDPN